MALLTIDELFTEETQASSLEALLRLCEGLGLPARSWRPGGIARTVLVAMSYTVEKVAKWVPLNAKSGFLDYAIGPWLTLVARNVFGVERKPSESAVGPEHLVNTSANEYAIDPGDLHFANVETGKTYTNTAACVIPAKVGMVNGTVDVDIEADEPGSASSAGPDTITQMVTPLLGVTATNAAALVGLDEESDDELRRRCRESRGALSPNGAASAYDFIAKSTSVPVNRTRTVSDLSNGNVTTYIANASGTAITGDDLTTVDDAIKTQCVPAGITQTTSSATPVEVAPEFTVKLYASANMTSGEFNAAAETALASYFSTVRIGGESEDGGATGYIFLDHLQAIVRNVSPLKVVSVVVDAPGSNVSLAEGDVAYLGSPTFTTSIVADP